MCHKHTVVLLECYLPACICRKTNPTQQAHDTSYTSLRHIAAEKAKQVSGAPRGDGGGGGASRNKSSSLCSLQIISWTFSGGAEWEEQTFAPACANEEPGVVNLCLWLRSERNDLFSFAGPRPLPLAARVSPSLRGGCNVNERIVARMLVRLPANPVSSLSPLLHSDWAPSAYSLAAVDQ